jgi:SAM-dependent methyltransferase
MLLNLLSASPLGALKPTLRRWMPIFLYSFLKNGFRHRPGPERHMVRFGSLRRLTPISSVFGFERGTPIDRYYIEGFLARHADDVRGRVMEIAEDTYTRRFGGERVQSVDILHVVEGKRRATIVADLQSADHIPSDTFDCIILTQTLQYIYDVKAALRTLNRILKPGGVLLATFPGLCMFDYDPSGYSTQWHFSPGSAQRLFGEVFPEKSVTIESHGNVFIALAFLHGIALEEVRQKDLDFHDPSYVISITVRARKCGGARGEAATAMENGREKE